MGSMVSERLRKGKGSTSRSLASKNRATWTTAAIVVVFCGFAAVVVLRFSGNEDNDVSTNLTSLLKQIDDPAAFPEAEKRTKVEFSATVSSKEATRNAELSASSEPTTESARKRTMAVTTWFSVRDGKQDVSDAVKVAQCAQETLVNYTKKHGYYFLNQDNFTEQGAVLYLEHMFSKKIPAKKGRFQKLRFLIQMLERYPDIEWFFWVDADAIITDQNVTIEEKLSLFEKMHTEQQNKHNDEHSSKQSSHDSLAMVIANDSPNMINSGVFLIRNDEIGRNILRTSYHTYVDPNANYADQSAIYNGILDQTLTNNTLYRHVLVIPFPKMHLMQLYLMPRIMKKPKHKFRWRVERNPWVLHMPHQTTHFRMKIFKHEVQICPWLPSPNMSSTTKSSH